jgi:hypothetical protein
LKQKKSAVYWVGLPAVRNPRADEVVKMMNEIARERAYLNGQKYIDAYAGFLDEGGGYSAYGPDLAGKSRLLRDGDEFTEAGYRKLAHFIERELKRDLVTAKNDRAIPLAGNEAEQARVGPARAAAKPAAAKEANAEAAKADPKAPPSPASPWSATAAQAIPANGDQKADNGKVTLNMAGPAGQAQAIEILRPAISASVLSLVTRRESPDRLSQMGDALVGQIPGGLTIMSSITPAS